MDMTTYELIINAAQKAALLTYDDAEQPEDLAPDNYDGDGQSWHFDRAEGFLGDKDEDTRDDSRACYLAAFWIEVRRLQNALTLQDVHEGHMESTQPSIQNLARY